MDETLEGLNINPDFHKDLMEAPSEVRGEILLLQENIEMLRWLMLSKQERGYAKDKERDAAGRIIVDLTKPHVLEDMDYFRPLAKYHEEHEVYTHLFPNPHPNSDYVKFWKEQERRCTEGYTRESDGEWIPGYYYFYLNFSPIQLTKDTLNVDGTFTGRSERIKAFPKIWDSDYLYFHYIEQAEAVGKFGTLLKTRGRGYSYKGAAMLSRNYTFKKNSKSFAMASDSEYLEDDGLLNTKTWDVLDWIDKETPWAKNRLKNTTLQKISGYVDPKDNKQKGYKSQIIGVTTGGNPEKGRGKRGKLILFEEAGIFPHLIRTWQIARSSLEDGNSTFGFMLAFGTGGSQKANFAGIEELFYRGDGYRVLTLKNVFDKSKGNGKCALFIPEYMNRKNCYDNNGNSNPIKALVELITDRNTIRAEASDSKALTQEKAERPITPQEAVLRFEGSLFPVGDLKEYLETIMPMQSSFIGEHYIGDLVMQDEGAISYKPNADAHVLRDFPITDNKNKEGAFEIFKMPVKNGMGDITRKRYIAGIDTYDDDESGTNSLGSIFIMDMLTDEIVAEYTGRPQTANKFYENCLKLLKFYNAEALYESNKKGLFNYFSQKYCLSYLADVPEILKDMEMIKGTNLGGNKSKGCNANSKINAWGRRLQADYMLMPVHGSEHLMQLQRIRSIAYLKEAIAWNEDGNFDRVSSMGMLMILREEYKKYIYSIKEEYNGHDTKYIGNDPFFNINYSSNKEETNPEWDKMFNNKFDLTTI